jgi:hypothetical protein
MPIRKTYRVCYLIVINLVLISVLNGCTTVPKKTITTIETKPRHFPTFKTPENVPFNQEPAISTTYVGIGTRTVPQFVIDPHATNKPPSNLSRNIAWRPARHFGAWNKGSDFGDINILLNGRGGSWFFNDYFSTMPENKQRIYKKYYRRDVGDSLDSVTLPSDVTTELVHLPSGQPEASAGAHNILLSLQQIDKTSKYGGSIKLVFKMADVKGAHGDNIHFDNFEYEFAYIDNTDSENPVTTLFNVDDVRLNIYVAPHPDEFNRTRNFSNQCKVLAEIDIDGVTAIQNDVRIENDSAYQNLKEALPAIGASAANNASPNYRAPHACALVQGFLHDQFQNELGELTDTTDIVDKILISDHFIDIFTREGQPVLTADWQITLIRIDTELGKDEPELSWFRVGHKYVDSYTNFLIIAARDPLRLEHMGASPTYALGNWLIDEICPEEMPSEQLLKHIKTGVGILEADPYQISSDDYMRTTEQIFPAPYCATIRATISSAQWGSIVDFTDRVNLYRDDHSHEPSNLYQGFYNYRAAYRLSVR